MTTVPSRLAATVLSAALLLIIVPAEPVAATTTPTVPGLPTGDAPGTNNWSCKPTHAHPRPVVLVHGVASNADTEWQSLGPVLKRNGYCVFALTYGESARLPSPLRELFAGLAPIEASAVQIRSFVRRVLEATRATKVDIVGHSEGTAVPDYYARFLGGGRSIDKYVSLAPAWRGSNAAGIGTLFTLLEHLGVAPISNAVVDLAAAPLREIATGSDYLARMNSGSGPRVRGIDYTNIMTKYDELVVPYTSGAWPGMHNIVLQNVCAVDFNEHAGIVADPIAQRLVLNALDPRHPKPVICKLTLPQFGFLPQTAP